MAMTATKTAGKTRVVRELLRVMGTVVTFDVIDDGSKDDVHVALASARAVLRRADAVFSLWKPDSPLSRVRRGELDVIDAPSEIEEVLRLCRDVRELSDGWFDAEAMPGGIDPTGLVKGWAAKRSLDTIRRAGFENALVNAGGDVAAAGTYSANHPWRIAVADPGSRARILGVVELDGSIATSGTSERGAHLYDPKGHRYSTRFSSASVVGPDLSIADGLATALVVAGEEGFSFIDAIDGYEAVVCDRRGGVLATSGFAFS